MSLKKPLVKQRTIKSSPIEEGILDDDTNKDKKSLNSTLDRKQVSFGSIDRQQKASKSLDDTDSDEENSLGRHNRPVKGGGLDSLFRSSGEGSDAVTKTGVEESNRRQPVGGRPRPVPRRHAGAMLPSSPDDDDDDDDVLLSTMRQPDKPVPSPRSQRQQADSKEGTTPKPRPRLSPREGSQRLGSAGSFGSDAVDGKDQRPAVPQRKKVLERAGPQIPTIMTSVYDDTEPKTKTLEVNSQQKGRKTFGRNSSGPAFELSDSSDDDDEGSRFAPKSSGFSSVQRRQPPATDEEQSSSRRPKPLPRGSSSPRSINSRKEDSVDNGGHSLQSKNLVKGKSSGLKSKTEVGRGGHTRTPAKREVDSVSSVERRRLAKATEEIHIGDDIDGDKRRLKTWTSGDYSDDETEPEKNRTRRLQKTDDTNRSPGRRGADVLVQLKGKFGSGGPEDRLGQQGYVRNGSPLGRRDGAQEQLRGSFESEDPNQRVGPKRSSTPLQRSSSFDAKRDAVQRKLSGSDRVTNNQHRSVPQRPASAKKKTYRTLERDVAATFEEHVPQAENVLELDDEPSYKVTGPGSFSRKGSASLKEHGSARPFLESTPKRGPMKASRGIEEMTRSPQLKSELVNEKHGNSSFSPGRSWGQKRASSMNDLTGRTPSPMNYDGDDDTARYNSLDTGTIRQAVFDDWMSKKNERLKKELAKKAAAKKEHEEKEKEHTKERSIVAKKAFECWSEKKSSVLKQHQSKRKEEKKKEEDKELEARIKKKDAVKFFDSWKAKKDEELKETHRKKKQEVKQKNRKKEEDKQEKVKSASKVYDNWKQRKDEKIKQELKEKRKKERAEAQQKEEDDYVKSLDRADKLDAWKQKKGPPRKGTPPPTLTQRAWCPGSRHSGDCIPQRLQPVVQAPVANRSRTLSASEQLRSTKYNY